jgi:protein SCO1/2
MSRKLKLVISALAGVAVGLAIAGAHWYREATGAGRAELPVLGTLPAFELVERGGQRVSRESLEGKVWVADFVFTHCAGPCPLISAKMSRLQDRVRELGGVRLVSFTVDPERDTPEVLAEYAQHYRADPELWLFLTGPKEPLYRLVSEGFHLAVDDGAMQGGLITHSTRFVLVDQQSRIRGYYDGAEPGTAEALLPDIRALLSE